LNKEDFFNREIKETSVLGSTVEVCSLKKKIKTHLVTAATKKLQTFIQLLSARLARDKREIHT
jgi:hypothetical protein